jgi:hypothetical protein
MKSPLIQAYTAVANLLDVPFLKEDTQRLLRCTLEALERELHDRSFFDENTQPLRREMFTDLMPEDTERVPVELADDDPTEEDEEEPEPEPVRATAGRARGR